MNIPSPRDEEEVNDGEEVFLDEGDIIQEYTVDEEGMYLYWLLLICYVRLSLKRFGVNQGIFGELDFSVLNE